MTTIRSRAFRFALSLPLTVSLSACSDGGSTEPDPDFTLTIAEAPDALTLGTETTFAVRLSSDDFDGTVDLTITGQPEGWHVELEDYSIALDDGESRVVPGLISVTSDAAAAPDGHEITIMASGAPGTRTVDVEVVVADEFILPIAAGAAGGDHWGLFSDGHVVLDPGSTVRIRNDDSAPHRIHAGDGDIASFVHQETSMGAGQSFVLVADDIGSDVLYCHDHPSGGSVTISVE